MITISKYNYYYNITTFGIPDILPGDTSMHTESIRRAFVTFGDIFENTPKSYTHRVSGAEQPNKEGTFIDSMEYL